MQDSTVNSECGVLHTRRLRRGYIKAITHLLLLTSRRYATTEKEALALILGVRAFSVYFGSSPVDLYTDHSPLQFLQRMSAVSQKLLRWNLELQAYNLDIKHRPGRLNVIPDIECHP
jgi:hypothetical protein